MRNTDVLSVMRRAVWSALLWMLVAGLCGSWLARAAHARRPMTVEDLWAVRRLGRPSLSPDGRWAVVEVTRYSMEENSSTSDLWLFSTEGAESRRLTTHPARDSSPAWSPDGRWIAFVSRREGDDAPQIYLISPEGGEARRLTSISTGAAAPKWFPDGRRLAFISWVWPDLRTDEEQARRLTKQREAKVKAYVIETTSFRYWDHWLADGRVPHLFVADVTTGAVEDLMRETGLSLTRIQPSSEHYDISPDGEEIAFVTNLGPDPGFDPNTDVLVLSLGRRTWQNITSDNPAHDGNPRYSPDGRWIAYTRQAIKHFYADRQRIVLYDRQTGQKRVLTESWDRSADAPVWAPESRELYFTAEDRARVPIWRLAITGGDPHAIFSTGTNSDLAISRDGRILAFLHSTMSTPPALFVAARDGTKARQIETLNDALVAQWKLGEVTEFTYLGWGGNPVQMWVIFPPDFDPKKRWPLLQIVHGGPHSAWLDQFHFRWNMHLFASRGYVVAAVNFHGSTGWGQAFTDSITGQYGQKELEDIERATDFLIAQGYIDPERLAAAGGSYGGYLVAWMNGHTTRYKAFVCHAGVYNWVSQMASDVVRGRDRALGAFPWEDPMRVLRQSAHWYAKNFKTPTLIMHGELDYRVPVTQAFEYYTTLRMLGVPARLVYFPDENHWILKPQNSRLWYTEFFAWIEKHIGAGPTAVP